MTDFRAIYASQADAYDALVSREDYQGNLLPALEGIYPLAGAKVVEFGAGTGRLTRLIAPVAAHVAAFDASAHMLAKAAERLQGIASGRWSLGVADNKQMPVDSGTADIALAGWSFGHAVGWYPDRWQDEIGAAIQEMRRLLRPGGIAIILETMTTGSETPRPPTDRLAAYYQWLERDLGFQSFSIRTDYRFESLEEAERLTRFFFGNALADRVVRENLVILPECTGIWHRRFDG